MGGWVEKERNMKEVEVLYIRKTLGWVFFYGSLPWSWTMGEFQMSVTLSHTRRAWLFHRHQWIFISDTADTLHHPDNWLPEAMLDWIAEIAGNLLIGVGITLSSINILLRSSSRICKLQSLHQNLYLCLPIRGRCEDPCWTPYNR